MSLTDDLKKNYSAMEGQLNDRSKELLRFYGKTAKSLDNSITELFQKYEIDGILTYEEMQKFNRLKSFFRQINAEYSKLSGKLLSLTIGSAEETIQEAYARQAWALEQEGKKVNINLAFTLIPMAAVNASVRAVADSGLNLISTIKKNRANALVRIQEEIQQSLIRGTSLRDIRAKIKQFWDGDAYKAERVLRTETLRVLEEGRKMATDEARAQGLNVRGVWLATLDSRTRDSHAEMDGKKTDDEGQFTLPTGEKVDGPHMTGIAGEDINCRCTTLESVDDSMPEQRAAGDDTIDYVTYEEWIDQKDLAASQLEKLAG
jgi:SPP1 gp7 family putative phage head morphogenesis protein